MNRDIFQILQEISGLLRICQHDREAAWFDERRKILETANPESAEYKAVLLEIRNNLAGMGSFSDLSMVPRSASGLSASEARMRQWDLGEELDEAVTARLASI